jgi:glycosyltransferase involved in cell wall biosynthesis
MCLERCTEKPKVLIFRNEILPSSETFIRAQTQALTRYSAYFAGVHRASLSMEVSPEPLLLDTTSSILGKVQRRIYWRTKFGPRLYRGVRKIAPSLVHAHFAMDGAAALPLAAHLNVPLVVTLHGYDVSSSLQTLSRCEEGRLFIRRRDELWQRASVFLCVSEFIRGRAVAAGFPKDKLKVHYIGSDLGHFEPSGTARDRNMILFVARLVEKKGLSYLIDAMAIVREKHPDARLVCIGDGPLREQMQSQVVSKGIPCQFLGSQSPEIVKRQLAQARIFCVPSVTASTGDSEGLGMVFAEAQAMGTPVVSFHHGGIPEVVLDGRTGLLAPERDVAALACNLCQLIADDAMWERFSANGMKWVGERFCLETQTALLEKIYDQLAIA